ncbi:Structural maintenance of chromosomes protein 6 [Cladophialophora chaetospira]|uniref:Structural maintenance of chromosomes protein 6 n=1 Tax=Cladophialophora chaetospira TaxID=386627 RepID=A0AA38WZT7_9EURO|nr:Structural maintenance of chromosomes protein 6 [Cladophialophora chaetospira]
MSRAQKRRAPADSDEESEANQESSPPRRTSNKRRRTSDESSIPQDTFSDQDDRGSTPPSDINSDNEVEDDEEIFLQMTQAIEARKDILNEPAEYGILEEVEVINFMCHGRFAFKLGPLINFICGKNGSGKSAILTAIILCLGGKASATNRGARLQNFIKEGEDHATIICKLKNQGENAYMAELYGATIQVERHIQRNGTSGFKLKSEKGRIVSTRKSDLEEICDHMMLQIENPLAVLSQDQARQFLSSSSAAEKYKFFMKGVQLEQLDQDYRLMEETLDNIIARIGNRLPDLNILKDKKDRATNKLALSDKFESMRDRMREIRRQLAWIQVEDKEKLRDDFAGELEAADAKIAEAQRRLDQIDAVYMESDQAAFIAKDNYGTLKADVDRLKDEKKDLDSENQDKIKARHEAAAELRQIRDALKSVDKNIANRQNAIQQEEQRLAELHGGGAAQRIAEREVAREAVGTATSELEDHKAQKQNRLDEVKRMQALEAQAAETKKKEDDRVIELEKMINNLKANNKHSDTAFHSNMPTLLQALQHETGFQERPIGPLGKHVKLLKPEWSFILEKSFGQTLNGFIVTTKRDETLLKNHMRRNRCDVPIFIANHLSLDVRPHLPADHFETILSVLEIDNDLVRKQLIIAHAIEQCVLIPSLAEATKSLFAEGRPPVPNIRRCFSFLPGGVKTMGRVQFYRGGSPASDPAHAWKGLPRMKTDAAENIRQQEDALSECKAQRLRADKELQSGRSRRVKAQQEANQHEKTTRRLTVALQEAQTRLDDLNDAIENDTAESGKLDQLQKALEADRQQKEVHESSYQDSVNNVDEKTNDLHAATAKCNDMDRRIEQADALAEQAKTAAQQADKTRSRDLKNKNDAFEKVRDAQADRGQVEQNLERIETEVADYTKQALSISERIHVPEGETHNGLEKKYKKLKEDHTRYQNQVGNRDELAADLAKWSTAYESAQKEIDTLESLQKQLTRTLTTRRHRWAQFRMFITARSRAGFIMKLSERGFRGTLHIDHNKKIMDIAVEPDLTRRNGEGRSAKTLSGGEKSFSQICLLLSIWDAMGVPIRCLDEFDVFMDAVNRNTSVKLLVDGARHSTGGQFILISPGTQSDIPIADDVNRVECAPPQRGQTTINFGRQ